MLGKRRRPADEHQDQELSTDPKRGIALPPAKRLKPNTDRLTPLSDELLIRILSFLSISTLLSVAPVSRRFDRLAADSQLWKALYYSRFVLPRALRIPGFREGAGEGDHKLHYSGRRKLWTDGRRGGIVKDRKRPVGRYEYARSRWLEGLGKIDEEPPEREDVAIEEDEHRVDWKRQYKIRHNWARGNCAVEELQMGSAADEDDKARRGRRKMLVKIVEGIAFTADAVAGLRVWDLKTRQILAQTNLHSCDRGSGEDIEAVPTSAAIDDQDPGRKGLDIALGFLDGSFGIWRYDSASKTLLQRSRHEKSSNGELVGIAYSHPFLLTATESVLISLYTLDAVRPKDQAAGDDQAIPHATPGRAHQASGIKLPPPYLVTSLRSHTSQPPLALSIRKLPSVTIASIAYTFATRQGWSLGIQDLHIKPADLIRPGSVPEVISTRLAYSAAMSTGRQAPEAHSSPLRVSSRRNAAQGSSRDTSAATSNETVEDTDDRGARDGPISLCYTHPYLLATLPDNTLVLHLCTSTSSALSISPGIRLWGHTSGISDAEITARGKAVSVSSRGEEMRVWELEGRPTALNGRSVEIRPNSPLGELERRQPGGVEGEDEWAWDDKRNWVGFDDEMVIVLKEARGGRESLMVYDFT